ncbi:MAG: WXG100 family type VII secretion target [Acutalibacteraceae bacterium]
MHLNATAPDLFEVCVKKLPDSSCFTEKLNKDVELFLNIFVDTEQMKGKADAVLNVAYELNENMNRIENLVLNLGCEWQGESERAFAAKILFVRKQFEALYGFLVDYAEVIKCAANDYENTENQILSQMEV